MVLAKWAWQPVHGSLWVLKYPYSETVKFLKTFKCH